MIAIITFFPKAVNLSIRSPAGTRYAARPVAMQRLGRAQLIRRLPVEIVLPRVQFTLRSQPGVYLHFYILYVPVSFSSLGFTLQVSSRDVREMTEIVDATFFCTFNTVTLRSLQCFHINHNTSQSLFCLPYRMENSAKLKITLETFFRLLKKKI